MSQRSNTRWLESNPLTPAYIGLLESENEYNFFHPRRGHALIISNIDFGGRSNRAGGENDHHRLERVFRQLEFDVEVVKNLTAQEMRAKMHEVATSNKYNHANADCFACAILSHGCVVTDQHDVVHDVIQGVDGNSVYTRQLVLPLRDTSCPDLKNKPKLIFIQACRGDDLDDGQAIKVMMPTYRPGHARLASAEEDESTPYTGRSRISSNPPEDEIVSPTPLYKDFMVMYATPPGFSAWRGRQGSYFIQYLEEVFRSRHREHISLVKTLTRVSQKMAIYFASKTNDETSDKKQMPCIMSMLTKDVCFRRKGTLV